MEQNESLVAALSTWLHDDPIVYACLTHQKQAELSDRETLLEMVSLMADRHVVMSKKFMDCMAHLPASYPITREN